MQLFLYNLLLVLYKAAIHLVSLFNEKAGLWITGRKNLMEHIATALQPGEQRIWIHSASLGEFEQGRPLIEALKKQYPQYKIVLTFFSPSGYEMRKNYEHADYVFYLPLDGRTNAREFLDLVQPRLAVFIKYEFWFYYLTILKKRGIPAILISAAFRPSQPFFQWYGGLFRKLLASFDYMFVQDTDSQSLLASIGFTKNVVVSGDTRYDRVWEISQAAKSFPLIEQWKGTAPLFIAGSTWPRDEKLLRESFAALPSGWKLILAPHEIGKAHVNQVSGIFGEYSVLYSELNSTRSEKRVLIIDNIGMLSSIYRYGEIAYIGGGFDKGGIHNTLEPAVFGLPVIFGPVYEKFVEARELVSKGYGFPVNNVAEMKDTLTRLTSNEHDLNILQAALRTHMQSGRGAAGKIMDSLKEVL